MLNLKDPTLFVEKALIGGAWLSTGSGGTVAGLASFYKRTCYVAP
jgi:hypothetical protein